MFFGFLVFSDAPTPSAPAALLNARRNRSYRSVAVHARVPIAQRGDELDVRKPAATRGNAPLLGVYRDAHFAGARSRSARGAPRGGGHGCKRLHRCAFPTRPGEKAQLK